MVDLRLIEKECKKCGNTRRFVINTPRDKQSICGNCWDWFKKPPRAIDIINSFKKIIKI